MFATSRRAGLKRAYVETALGQVNVYDSGEAGGGIPLLLLHQSPTSSHDYRSVWPELIQRGARVLSMDTPGFGLSDTPLQPPTIDDYASVVPAVLEAKGLKSAHLLGHHTGAQIAVAVAAARPERVRSVVSYGIPLFTRAELDAYWQTIVPRERDGPMHRPVPDGSHLTQFFAHWTQDLGFTTAEAQRMMTAALMAGPDWWYGHNAALTYDMADAFARMKAPLLLLSSTDEMLHAQALRAREQRPELKIVTLETAPGATAMDAAPAAFAEAVIAFVREVEG